MDARTLFPERRCGLAMTASLQQQGTCFASHRSLRSLKRIRAHLELSTTPHSTHHTVIPYADATKRQRSSPNDENQFNEDTLCTEALFSF